MKQRIIILFCALAWLPICGQEVLQSHRYYSTFSNQFEKGDVLAPFTGMPTRNPGYFYSFRRGVYYGEHFPWIYSEAYGWCYVYHYEFQSIYYIIGGGLKINSPLEKEINGWYKLGPMHLVVKSDESFPYVYWGQDIQSIDTGETIHVNLRWMECEVKFYKLQPVAGTDATR